MLATVNSAGFVQSVELEGKNSESKIRIEKIFLWIVARLREIAVLKLEIEVFLAVAEKIFPVLGNLKEANFLVTIQLETVDLKWEDFDLKLEDFDLKKRPVAVV